MCGFFRILTLFSTENAVHKEIIHIFALKKEIIHIYIYYENKRTYKKQRL